MPLPAKVPLKVVLVLSLPRIRLVLAVSELFLTVPAPARLPSSVRSDVYLRVAPASTVTAELLKDRAVLISSVPAVTWVDPEYCW
ncbi:hypothetical protein MCEMAEM4_03361 [Burkholderiaceae bacterium]